MKVYTLLAFTVLFVACSPNINYLGDTYPPTLGQIDVYYDQGDIERDYKVIGQLQGDNSNNQLISLDEIRAKMIEEAKRRGAEGILFLMSDTFNNDHIIRAKLIRYKN